jgi:tRNA(fMet)-specific endonuclease VapC
MITSLGQREHPRYMLDTNTASYIIKGHPRAVRERVRRVAMGSVYISAITQAELLHGVARGPEAKDLPVVVREFLLRVEILPWDSDAAENYAKLRAACEKEGKSLGAMDMLVAAHAVSIGAVLITSDRAFYNVKHLLKLADWTVPFRKER